MESKTGGVLSIIGGIIVLLSILFNLFIVAEFASETVGYVVNLGDVLTVLQEEVPWLYIIVIIGMASSILCGCILLVIGVLFIVGKGTGPAALLAVTAGLVNTLVSILLIGGIVGIIGGVLGWIGGILMLYARPRKEVEALPPPSFPTTGADT
jgi:hypothetical protein